MKMIEQKFECYTPITEYSNFIKRMEHAGRVCYKSEDKITDGSAEKFIRGIIKSGHETILEHSSLTIKFTVDTKTATALTRHRHGSPSQESTHYINYGKKKELIFVRMVNIPFKHDALIGRILEEEEAQYYKLIALGVHHTIARTIMPFALKAEVVITANIREWRHILKLRADDHAHFQMRTLMRGLLTWFREELPIFVEDIKGKNYGD